jgi:hypothetical protein
MAQRSRVISIAFTAKACHARRPVTIEDDDVYAITANDVTVGADVAFACDTDQRGPFIAKGAVSIINARVGGDFTCEGDFQLAGEEALSADGITVSGTTFFDCLKTDGILRLLQANLKQGFSVRDAIFDPTAQCRNCFGADTPIRRELGGPVCGIYAPCATIGGEFAWKRVTKQLGTTRNPFWLHLAGTKAEELEDDETSWAAPDRFEITDFAPVRLGKITDGWRLKQLDRQYAILNGCFLKNWALGIGVFFARRASVFTKAAERFRPQPYIQLARSMRAAGYDTTAKDVLVHLERNRTRYSDYDAGRQFWRWLLDATIRYGYSPFKPVGILLVWAFVCSWIFQTAFDNGRIVSIKELQATSSSGSSPRSPGISFNPLIYAIDTLVPIVDLNQKKNWIVNPLSRDPEVPQPADWWSSPGRIWDFLPQGTGALIVFNTFFGWLMTSLFVAGVSGLLRTRDV